MEAVRRIPLAGGVRQPVGRPARLRRPGRFLAGVGRVDVERPGQGGGRTVQLLVDAVAHAADGLRQDQARRQDVEPAQQLEVVALRVDGDGHQSADHRAVDPQTPEPAVPERDDLDRMLRGSRPSWRSRP